MTATSNRIGIYADDTTFAQARAAYFADYGFGADGGYDAPTVRVKLGPIPIELPNINARKQALPYHDAHHIVTAYPPTSANAKIGSEAWHGEAEVAAWETGTGWIGLRYWEPWVINSYAIVIGLAVCRRKTFRAYLRGRRSTTLYDQPLDERLQRETLGAIRERLGLKRAEISVAPHDRVTFLWWSFAAYATVAAATLLIILPLALAQAARRIARSRPRADDRRAGGA